MKRILSAVLAGMLGVAFASGIDSSATDTFADQNCLGWERDMRSAAGYDDLARPSIDRLAGD